MPTPRKPKRQQLEFTITYRVDVENANLDEALEKLREFGAAEIISTRVVNKSDS